MFALRDSRRGMAGGAKGEAPEAWTPKRVWGPTEGVGAWTVAKATATKLTSRRRGGLQAPKKRGGPGACRKHPHARA